MMTLLPNHLYTGDALATLRTFPDASVQCVVTSPPYFGLRDYGVAGQIGLEPTPAEYIANLVAIFAEARRVLKDNGVLWVNLGDTYGTGTKAPRKSGNRGLGANTQIAQDAVPRVGGIAKSRLFIPHRFAIAMQDAGWIARDEIVWHKRTPMPESVKDRTTRAHEFIFLFSKQPRYYYNAAAVAEKTQSAGGGNFSKAYAGAQIYHGGESNRRDYDSRNLRSVWTLSPDNYSGAHFATFPREIPRRCILASTRPDDVVLDPFMGAGTTAIVARQLGRAYVGIELNPDYVTLANERLADPKHAQLDLFACSGVAA